MNILIIGAGAVGSAFGGFLRKGGHAVTLVGRPEHLEAIQQRGLAIRGIWGEHKVTGFSCRTDLSGLGRDFDAILMCVKSYDTATAASGIKHLLEERTLLVSLQNGLGNMEAVREATEHPLILGGRVIFGIILTGPGQIKITVYTEPVMLGFPKEPRANLSADANAMALNLAAAVNDAGIPCRTTDEIEKYLWSKLLYNCALNPLGAIHRVHYGALAENPAWKSAMDGIIREIFVVARAKGVELFWNTPEEFLTVFYGKLVPDTYHHRSSMLQDIEKGKRTEIDSMNGMIVRYGQTLGVPTPINQEMAAQIQKGPKPPQSCSFSVGFRQQFINVI